MAHDDIACPYCHLSDQVEKVSTLYLLGIGLKIPGQKNKNNSIGGVGAPFASRELAQRLRPPSSGKSKILRPVHPDLVILTFAMILPIFVWGIFTQQRMVLAPTIVVLMIFFGLYVWKRKDLVAKFIDEKEREKRIKRDAEGAVKRWMALYYCARDDLIFTPDSLEGVPCDEMDEYLQTER